MPWSRPPSPIQQGPEAERRLTGLQRRFRDLHERFDRNERLRGFIRWLPVAAIAAAMSFAATFVALKGRSPEQGSGMTTGIPMTPAKGVSRRAKQDEADAREETGPVFFANCAAARGAGAAPIYWGEPGYRPPLDRDNDGVACELYPR